MLEALNQDITILVVSHDLVAISTHVKSVACINKRLHHHHQAEITGEMLEEMYRDSDEDEVSELDSDDAVGHPVRADDHCVEALAESPEVIPERREDLVDPLDTDPVPEDGMRIGPYRIVMHEEGLQAIAWPFRDCPSANPG